MEVSKIVIDSGEPFEPFLGVTNFKLLKELHSHSSVNVEGILVYEKNKDTHPSEWLNKVIKITVCKDTSDPAKTEESIFCGNITDVTFEKQGIDLTCRIEAKSLSLLMDKEPQTRFFQDATKKYSDVIDIILGKYKDKIMPVDNVFSKELKDFLVQYEETDWEFLLRICRRVGVICFVADEDFPLKIYFEAQNENSFSSEDNYILSVNNETEFLKLREEKILFPGDSVCFSNRKYIIFSAKHEMINNVLKNEYAVIEKERLYKLNSDSKNIHISGKLIKATVVDNCDPKKTGRIKIKFDGEDPWSGTRFFPFLTPFLSENNSDGTGFFSLPETGVSVLVSFSGNYENESYVTSALREKIENRIEDPSHKIWRNRKGREFKITDDSISVSSKDDDVYIMLENKQIILKCGKSYIKMSNGSIEVSDGGKGIIKIQGNIGISGKNIDIKGSRIKLN
jgi:hypothetical protein